MQMPDVSTPAKSAAVGIEDMIRHNSIETGVLIAPDGSTVIKRRGWADRVGFMHSELKRAQGMTFTHNHPSGFGPSLEDIRLGALYGMKEVRVVTARFRHGASLLRPQHIGPLSRSFGHEEAGAILAVRDEVKRGLIHPHDFSAEVRHRTWQRMSVRLGFNYWRQES